MEAEIIAGATLLLEDDEARAAEAEVLDRAARLTPAGLRAAIARAVIKAAQEGEGTPGDRGEERAGGTVAAGHRQRRADGLRAAPGPKCRHDHRLKQHLKWKVDQLPDGTFRWTTPAGRSYDTEPTRYPI
jgi:hypothetical protein